MPRHPTIPGAFTTITLLFLTACATPTVQTPPPETKVCPPPLEPIVETKVVRDPELEREVTRLKLQLMERDARLESQESRLEQALQEVVSTMRNLRSAASRAEAASAMAETDVALQAINTADRKSREYEHANRLMQQSSEEFKRKNYGGALFLAKQAKSTIRLQSLRSAEERHTGEILFAAPVKLSTTQHSNVRNGPGTEFSVSFIAKPGSALSGLSYVEEWIRVIDEPGNEGWIYAPLVVRRENVSL